MPLTTTLVIEAKWTGSNSAKFANSINNPRNHGVYNEARILDQIERQIQFAQEQGLRGVRWATSNQAARDHFESLFRTHFEEYFNSGFIRAIHLPGAGM